MERKGIGEATGDGSGGTESATDSKVNEPRDGVTGGTTPDCLPLIGAVWDTKYTGTSLTCNQHFPWDPGIRSNAVRADEVNL